MTALAFAWPGYRGEAAEELAGEDLPAIAARLLDPACATATLHWGRNYIYRATWTADRDSVGVAVKQFRSAGKRVRARAESKAAKSFRLAREFRAAGLPTPEPLLYVETEDRSTAIFVTRALDGFTELRYLLRARNAQPPAREFAGVELYEAIAAVGRLARRMHDAGFWHRDFSIGNLLLRARENAAIAGESFDLELLDLNRARRLRVVPLPLRMRDLCRLPLEHRDDRDRLLASYFGGPVPAPARLRYELARRAFLRRNQLKAGARGVLAKAKSWLVPRGTHAHIPPAPEGAAARDKIVWDALSDQPHSHASRWERTRVRLADAPSHLASFAALTAAAPRIRGRYLELGREPVAPFAWPEPGVALRPWPANPQALLEAFDELGARRALIRLHPWQEQHDDEERLARELADRGIEIAFSLPQNRELVRDPARWRAAIEELATRFRPFGRRFQIGQAINRSKWGVWSHDDYLDLAADAAEILRRPVVGLAEAELFGPAVIDFEAHATAAIVNRRRRDLHFDGLASLLYVDRRGAPENRQLGFDTTEKVRLLAAIAGTGRLVDSGRQWISEVNWPLREGPHSPAGKSVSVDEELQADYLARFFLLAGAHGLVERIDWWQLVAKGYGLIDPQADGTLRRRAAFRTFATLRRQLAGATCNGPMELPGSLHAVGFHCAGTPWVAAWSAGASASWSTAVEEVVERDGRFRSAAGAVALDGSVRYLRMAR